MAVLGGSFGSYEDIRDDYMERARLARLVADTLGDARQKHEKFSPEHDALCAAERTYLTKEFGDLEYAGWMYVAILCEDAGYHTGCGSVADIEAAHEEWLASLRSKAA